MKLFFSKLFYWLFTKKDCRKFCPTCEYYDLCKSEVLEK